MFRTDTYCPSSGVLILYSQQMVFVILVTLTFTVETQGHNLNSLTSKTWEPILVKKTQSFVPFPCCKFWNIWTMFHKKFVCMFITLMPCCCFMYYYTAINWNYIFSNIYLYIQLLEPTVRGDSATLLKRVQFPGLYYNKIKPWMVSFSRDIRGLSQK